MIFNTGESSEELKEKYNPEGSEIRRIQYRMLDMLDYLNDVCCELKIQYRLDGGTCLGAIRHKGFIPWDDDLDVVLSRKDWKKIVKHMIRNPHPQFKIQCNKTDKGYLGAWAVLRDTKSEYLQDSIIHNIRKYRGAQIDLFPYDKGNIISLQKLSARLSCYLVDNNIKAGRINAAKFSWYILHNIVFPIFRMFNVFGNKDKVSHSYGTGWFSTDKYYIDLKDVIPYKPIEFEGKMYPGPADPVAVVTRIYGAYMDLPPKEQRDHHKANYNIWD